MKRMTITQTIKGLDLDFDGVDLTDAIKTLTEIQERYAKDYDRLYIEYDGYGDGYYEMEVKGERLETEEAYQIRVDTEARKESVELLNKRGLFEKLKIELGES